MIRALAVLLAILAAPAAAQTEPATALPRRSYRALPLPIQSKIDEVVAECGAPLEDATGTSAMRLDANTDGHEDFIFVPGEGLTRFPNGPSGYCSANWVPVLMWVFNGRGGYHEVTLGAETGLLRSPSGFMFTHDCDGQRHGGVSLAVLNREGTELVGYGQCYATLDEALAAGRRQGFNLVRLG